jgi:hypothetical protein
MDRRDVKRFAVQYPVKFFILGGENVRYEGELRDVSVEGLRLASSVVLETGSFLRIEIEDSVFFGEVKYSHPWMNVSIAGLYIERVLMGKSDLSRLVALASQHAPQLAALIS